MRKNEWTNGWRVALPFLYNYTPAFHYCEICYLIAYRITANGITFCNKIDIIKGGTRDNVLLNCKERGLVEFKCLSPKGLLKLFRNSGHNV